MSPARGGAPRLGNGRPSHAPYRALAVATHRPHQLLPRQSCRVQPHNPREQLCIPPLARGRTTNDHAGSSSFNDGRSLGYDVSLRYQVRTYAPSPLALETLAKAMLVCLKSTVQCMIIQSSFEEGLVHTSLCLSRDVRWACPDYRRPLLQRTAGHTVHTPPAT
ncbi:hypothetical protein BV20DRAFT_563518 [Pilatotrama ljubarskyi]|nr:hypothetical protein BV20DRAFT_563518 [Pilatotrama ljubarskyi]